MQSTDLRLRSFTFLPIRSLAYAAWTPLIAWSLYRVFRIVKEILTNDDRSVVLVVKNSRDDKSFDLYWDVPANSSACDRFVESIFWVAIAIIGSINVWNLWKNRAHYEWVVENANTLGV